MPQTFTFGEAPDDADLLVVQGVTYHLQPLGMRKYRQLLNSRAAKGDATPLENLEESIDFIVACVTPGEREQMREHIEESVSPVLLAQIARVLMRGQSDVDPTQPASSSAGSPPGGSTSTAGAQPAA